MAETIKIQHHPNHAEAARLFGDAMAARHLLEIKQSENAERYVIKAKNIAADLVKKAPDLIVTDTINLSKTSYVHENESKDYFAPISESDFIVDDYDVIQKAHKDAVVDIKDSVAIGYRYELNAAALKTSIYGSSSPLVFIGIIFLYR